MSAALFTFCQKLESSRINFVYNKVNLFCMKCTFDTILNNITAKSLDWINGSVSYSTKVGNLLFLYNQSQHHNK